MLTGSSGFYGRALLKGNELAVEEINANGGLLGEKVELVSADNASDNAQTVNLVRKFGQDKSVSALIAPTYQPNMEAGCAIATSLGIAQIAGQSAPPPAKVNPKGFCFTNSANVGKQVEDTIGFVAKKTNATRIAQVYDQQNAYQTQFDKVGTEYIKSSGLESVLDAGVNTGVTDYGPLITKMLQADAEVVVPNLTTEDAARFMQQARARGLKATFVGPNASLVNVRLYDLSHGAADGLIVSTNQSESEEAYGSFVKAFNAKFGEIEDPISGFGYDSVMALAEAVKKAGSADRAKIQQALASLPDFCASICYEADGKGNFITTKLFYVSLSEDGFSPTE